MQLQNIKAQINWSQSLTRSCKKIYEGPINHHGSGKLINALNKVFLEHTNDALAVNISYLRNELTHVGKPKKMTNQLNKNDYIYVALLLKLIIVSHL